MLGLRAIARMFSNKTFFNGGSNVGYGVRRPYFSSLGFNCTSLWLFSDPRGTAVFQKYVRRDSVFTIYTLIL